jgi:hypothetical protein
MFYDVCIWKKSNKSYSESPTMSTLYLDSHDCERTIADFYFVFMGHIIHSAYFWWHSKTPLSGRGKLAMSNVASFGTSPVPGKNINGAGVSCKNVC